MNKLDEIKKHEEMKQLSIYSYDIRNNKLPQGYSLIGISPMDNGFYACVVKKENNITIVFRGTEGSKDKNDLKDDLRMARGKWPKQADNALDLYDHIRHEYPNCNITVTGHSLGGSLAQIVGVLRNVAAVTFNAYGTAEILKNRYGSMIDLNKKFENITNYCNPKDWITTKRGMYHIGTCYEVFSKIGTEGNDNHLLEYMETLKVRMPSSPEDLQMCGNKNKREKEEF